MFAKCTYGGGKVKPRLDPPTTMAGHFTPLDTPLNDAFMHNSSPYDSFSSSFSSSKPSSPTDLRFPQQRTSSTSWHSMRGQENVSSDVLNYPTRSNADIRLVGRDNIRLTRSIDAVV